MKDILERKKTPPIFRWHDYLYRKSQEISRKLLELIINLAKEYNFEVVCEGIENMDQINILKNLNCNIVQGFVYYRPISIDKLKDVLNK